MKKILGFIFSVIVIIGVIFFIGKNNNNEDLVIKIGYRNIAGHFATMVAREKKLFEKENIKVEYVPFSSGSESYNALIRGDIDMDPYLTIIPILVNEAKDPGLVKITMSTELTDEEQFDALILKKNSSINNLSDLVNKKVGVFPGTTAKTFLKIVLVKNNVNTENIEFVELQGKDHLIALESGAVDAIMAYEPTIAIALTSDSYRQVHGSMFSDAFPNTPIAVHTYNSKFTNEHKNTVDKLNKIYSEVYRITSEDRTLLNTILAKEFNLENEVVTNIGISKLHAIDKDLLTNFAEFLYANKEIKSVPNIDNLLLK